MNLPPASTASDVVEGLSSIVASSIDNGDRDGYFASMYRQVTVEVQAAIEAGLFDDGPRMSLLTANFGNLYFDAYKAWHLDGSGPSSWRETFNLANHSDSIIVQHLLLGVNAHINLDLAIAAVRTAPGSSLVDLKRDFFVVNNILDRVYDKLQEAIVWLSPYLWLADVFAGRTADWFLDFSYHKARQEAWQHAVLLSSQTSEEQLETIERMDSRATLIARLIARPSGLVKSAVDLIHNREVQDVSYVISRLDRAMSG